MHRHRVASRLTSWLFVAALLLKSAVPMLASAAAGLQGKATAEVCDVYGVDTSLLRVHPAAMSVPAGAGGHHHAHHEHHAQGDGSTPAADPAPSHGPASRVGHGGDHCALSALAFALASDAPGLAAPPAASAPAQLGSSTAAAVVDPAARWVAQLQHGPPASS